jgi:prepilin-type N-terminal cleavage/methylation domain-containing protein
MRKAMTLIELVLVLVIIAVLGSVAVSSFKLNHLRDDVNIVFLKFTNTKYQAVGYEKALNDIGTLNYAIGCIDLDSESLKNTKNEKTKSENYKFHSSVTNDSDVSILCFDNYGRTYDGSIDDNKTSFESLLYEDVNISLSYAGKKATLSIQPRTGYIKVIYW